MSKHPPFVEGALARLMALGPLRARAMFGGHGLYLDDLMFALIARQRLYFKVDSETEAAFAEAGAAPFTYLRRGRKVAMSYREAPPGTLDDPTALLPWAELGLAAARRARVGRGKPKTKRNRRV